MRSRAEGFKLAVLDGHADDPEPILHSNRFVLVDSRREIRGYHDGGGLQGVEMLRRRAAPSRRD